MKSVMFRVIVICLFVFTLPFSFAANKALVIGNNNYSGRLPRLTNPINDANVVADALRSIGFQVTVKTDLNYQDFRTAINEFARNVDSSDVAFIYYAGHGLALNNNDYLLPIYPTIEAAESVEFNAINAQEVLNLVSKNSLHTVFILDACRDNPFFRSAGTRGLGNIRSSRGSSYILYSATLGEVASDDGTFARILAAELRKPQSIDDIRAKILQAVSNRTGGKQNPNSVNRLSVGTLYFLKTNAQPASSTPHKQMDAKTLYQQGHSSFKKGDYQSARQLWEQAATQGHALAQTCLGFLYSKGNGVAQDYTQAKYWYEKAAVQGNTDAQYNLGVLYNNGGNGVAQDYTQAKYWYEKAAAQDYASAQINLGFLYSKGNGVAQDYTQAKYWFEKAAAQDDAGAQYNLGVLYNNGNGVAQDYTQAKYWYEKAAAQGNTDALRQVNKLKKMGY